MEQDFCYNNIDRVKMQCSQAVEKARRREESAPFPVSGTCFRWGRAGWVAIGGHRREQECEAIPVPGTSVSTHCVRKQSSPGMRWEDGQISVRAGHTPANFPRPHAYILKREFRIRRSLFNNP